MTKRKLAASLLALLALWGLPRHALAQFWTDYGSLPALQARPGSVDLAIDNNMGTLYLAFAKPGAAADTLKVWKHDGTQWFDISPSAAMPLNAPGPEGLVSEGIYYVLHADKAQGGEATVKQYQSGWDNLGTAGFSLGDIQSFDLAMAPSFQLNVVMAFNSASNGKLYVYDAAAGWTASANDLFAEAVQDVQCAHSNDRVLATGYVQSGSKIMVSDLTSGVGTQVSSVANANYSLAASYYDFYLAFADVNRSSKGSMVFYNYEMMRWEDKGTITEDAIDQISYNPVSKQAFYVESGTGEAYTSFLGSEDAWCPYSDVVEPQGGASQCSAYGYGEYLGFVDQSGNARVQYPNNPTAGCDFTTCSSNTIVEGSMLPIGEMGSWAVISGPALQGSGLGDYTFLTFGSPGTATLSYTWLSSGLSATVSVTYEPLPASAGPDLAICGDFAQLQGSEPEAGYSGYWSSYDPGVVFSSTSAYNATATNFAIGTTTVLWIVSSSKCSATDTVLVTSYDVSAIAGVDQSVCTNTASLVSNSAPAGFVGLWSVKQGSASFASPNTSNTAVSGLGLGPNVLVWTLQGACEDSDSMTVTNNSITLDLGPDLTGCLPEAEIVATITSYASATVEWESFSPVAYFETSSETGATVAGLDNGPHAIRATASNGFGCVSIDDVTITNVGHGRPYVGSESFFCTPVDYIYLVGEPGGAWLFEPAGEILSQEGSNYLVELSVGSNTIEYSAPLLNGCAPSDQLVVEVQEVAPDAGPDTTYTTLEVQLAANDPQNGSPASWEFVNGPVAPIFSSLSDPNATMTVTAWGVYVLEWRFELGGECIPQSDQLILRIFPPTDFGDLPVSYEQEINADNKARHFISDLRLGQLVDAEPAAQPHPLALGDDLSGQADDDGVSTEGFWPMSIPQGGNFDVEANGTNGCLSVWIDWNRDGYLDDAAELAIDRQAVGVGQNRVTFDVPAAAFPEAAFYSFNTRFRLYPDTGAAGCADQSVSYFGAIDGGEVEDYLVMAAVYQVSVWDGSTWSNGEPMPGTWILLAEDFDFEGQQEFMALDVLSGASSRLAPGSEIHVSGLHAQGGKSLLAKVMRIE